MSTTSFDSYKAARLAEGFDEVLERVWTSNAVAGEHTHPFSVKAQVVQGDLWLSVGASTRHLRAGDAFELGHSVPHSERYGETGAIVWAARKHDA